MALGDVIARLSVELGLDTAAFEKGATLAEKRIAQSTKKIEAMGKSMVGLGQKLSIGLTAPLAAFGFTAFKAATESREAFAQVEAALASMGNASGKTAEDLKKAAAGLQRFSNFDDDDILKKVTANMLTFGNVAGEQFDRAQQAAVDLSARLGQDLQSSALMVGKALNDPAKGIAALTRVGIQFTEQQKDQIKAMAAAGDAAGAQSIILGELEKQFGGAAKAQREAAPGGDLAEQWRTFQEIIGERLVQAFEKLEKVIAPILDRFNNLSPSVQTALVVVGALAAAIGPLLIALGFAIQGMAPFIAAVGAIGKAGGVVLAAKAAIAGLTVAFGPWLIAIAAAAAAGYLIYQNWDKIAPVLTNLWQTIQTTIGPPLMELIGALTDAFTSLWNGPLGSAIKAVMPVIVELGKIGASVFGTILVNNIKILASVVGAAFQAIALAVRTVSALFDGTFKTVILNAVRGVYEGVKTWLVDRLSAIWETVKAKIETVKKAFFNLYDAVVGNSYIPDMVDGIAEQMRRLDAVMVDPAKKATAKVTEAFRKLAADVKPLLDELFPEEAAANEYASKFARLEAARKGGILNGGQFSEATERLQNNYLADRPANDNAPAAIDGWDSLPLIDMQALNVEFERFSASVTAAIPNLGGLNGVFAELGINGQALKTDLSRAFTDILMGAQSFGDAMRGVFSRLAASILDNAFDNLLGSALGGIIPGFATGTSYAPGGLALVGERGPELVNLPRGSQVFPNAQTDEMLSGGGTDRRVYMTVNTPNADSFRRSERQISRDLKRRVA